MKIVVFGATGGTGIELVKQALDKGHEVTAIVRNPEAMKENHVRLRVVSGDAMRPDSFVEAFKNQDAILSAIGISSFWQSLSPMTFHRQTACNIVEKMKLVNVKRLICVTSVGVIDNPTAPLFYNLIIHPLLKHKYEDMRQMETAVRESDLQWTIVRPFRLTNGERTEKYRVASNGELENGGSISRADVADFMLKQLETEEHLHKTPAISY
jgi:biliverdin reductase/flavin reductase